MTVRAISGTDAAHRLDERIRTLSPAKRALLERALGARRRSDGEDSIARRAAPQAPLSYNQQQLWFMEQLSPGAPAYNVPGALRLRGPLNLGFLQRSFTEIVRRHEILRTTFPLVDDEPVQRPAPAADVELPLIDLTGIPDSQREPVAVSLAADEASRPFDLARGPHLRVRVIRLDDLHHILLLTVHHIVYDGWSTKILLRELASLYRGYLTGMRPALPALSVQYGDFAVWQEARLRGRLLDERLSFWTKQLSPPHPPPLPTDHPRPLVPTQRGERHSVALSAVLARQVRDLSRRESVTPFIVLLTALKGVLHRYTGHTDVIVGTPIAGRDRVEIEPLIGLFVNTLVLRTSLSGDPTCRELLHRVRDVTLDGYSHQDLPFQKVIETVQPDRLAGSMPLIQAVFMYEAAGGEAWRLPGVTVSEIEVPQQPVKADLTVAVSDRAAGLVLTAEYNGELFERETVAALLADFRVVLDAFVADLQRPLRSLPAPASTRAAEPGKASAVERIEHASNLTANQRLIWAGQALQPGVPIYNLMFHSTLPGSLRVEHFSRAFEALVRSSDVLRTIVLERDGVPHRVVLPTLPCELELLNFSGGSNPSHAFDEWVRARAQRPLDVARKPFESGLARLSDTSLVWFWHQHHLLTDGWSVAVVLKRLAELYELSVRGRLDEAPRSPSYEEHVQSERAYRQSDEFAADKAYWERRLSDPAEPLPFYGRRTRPSRSARVQRVSRDLGVERSRKLAALARRASAADRNINAATFNILATVLFAYLYRLTGVRRLAFGTPVHNRRTDRAKETIGLFMHVLPVAVSVDDRDTFDSLLDDVRVQMAETLRHRRYAVPNPLDARTYDVSLNLLNMPFRFGGEPVPTMWVHTGHENDALGIQVHDLHLSGTWTIDFDFHCDVFDADQRERAITHFLHVLDACLDDPTRSLGSIPLVAGEEARRVLRDLNETRDTLPEGQTALSLFEAEVRAAPDRVAVATADRQLSYAALNARANQVGRFLRRLGVGPDVRVGVCMDRSLELIASLLGVWKAGGAYVPVDPAHPDERVEFALRDAGVPVLLTQERLARTYAPSIRVECVDSRASALAEESDENLPAAACPANLAYVIYTSGSTGVPKGVMVSHGSLLNAYRGWEKAYGLRTGPRTHLQMANVAFDVFTGDLVRALCSGGKLVLCPHEWLLSPPELYDLMQREGVDCAEWTPAVLGHFVQHLAQTGQSLGFMRLVVAGSDSWSSADYQHVRDLCGPQPRVVNSYGATEAAIDSSYFEGEALGDTDDGRVPIGRPFANTQLYVLDRHLQPVPVGVAGELSIGGPGLARGYLNRPDLTAEKFVPHPFSDAPGARLYRSGDLARHAPDGNLEFLGRIDEQVKIRGFRIEPGEIAAVLRAHPAVREAAVIAREDRAGQRYLAAYVVFEQPSALEDEGLRAFLRSRLPDYMVPAHIVRLDALPLTPNGKIDRRALPAPDEGSRGATKRFVKPRSTPELHLALLWEELLDVRPIGVTDNFFDLGGHSLLAVRLIARIRRQFGNDMPLSVLFQAPTIEQLAVRLGKPETWPSPSPLVALQPRGARTPFFCVHSIGGYALRFYDLARHVGPDQPFYGLQAPPPAELGDRYLPISDMAASYVAAIRSVQADGPYFLGGYSFGSIVAFEMARQLESAGQEVALLALIDGASPLVARTEREPDDVMLAAGFARDLARAAGVDLQLAHEVLRQRNGADGLATILEKLHAAHLLSAEIDIRWLRAFLQGIRLRMQAVRVYEPGVYGGTITFFRSIDQEVETAKAWREIGVDATDPADGWRELSRRPLVVHEIRGHHVTMMNEPHVRALAARLAEAIARASRSVRR